MRVDVWSDVVCPWCYIGKRRLERAIAASGIPDVEVVHRAFQLDPGAVTQGERTVDVLARKYTVTPQQAAAMMDQVAEVAAGVGLDYRLGETLSGNTRDAHRIILWAQGQGHGQQMAEAIMRAYFIEARGVFSAADLLGIVEETALDPAAAAELLQSDRLSEQVAVDQAGAAAIGATGVPTFVFDGVRGFSGAQPDEVFAQFLTG